MPDPVLTTFTVVTAPEHVDSSNLAAFRQDISEARDRAGDLLIADLRATVHLSYPAIGVLNDARRRCNMTGRHLIVVCTDDKVIAAFRQAGLSGIFDLRAEMPDAAHAEPGGDPE